MGAEGEIYRSTSSPFSFSMAKYLMLDGGM